MGEGACQLDILDRPSWGGELVCMCTYMCKVNVANSGLLVFWCIDFKKLSFIAQTLKPYTSGVVLHFVVYSLSSKLGRKLRCLNYGT